MKDVKYYVAYRYRGWADVEDINFDEPFSTLKEASEKSCEVLIDDDTSAVFVEIDNAFFKIGYNPRNEVEYTWVCKETSENDMIVERKTWLTNVLENPEKFEILRAK